MISQPQMRTKQETSAGKENPDSILNITQSSFKNTLVL